jgi:hypothetical protein
LNILRIIGSFLREYFKLSGGLNYFSGENGSYPEEDIISPGIEVYSRRNRFFPGEFYNSSDRIGSFPGEINRFTGE